MEKPDCGIKDPSDMIGSRMPVRFPPACNYSLHWAVCHHQGCGAQSVTYRGFHGAPLVHEV